MVQCVEDSSLRNEERHCLGSTARFQARREYLRKVVS